MNLTVRINDIEYKANCVQGVTFAEEYNETLDSGTIRLSHIPKIKKLRPYDDVYIYSTQYIEDTASDSIWGQHSKGDEVDFYAVVGSLRLQRELVDAPIFYRHLLVDQFTENILNLGEGIFAYTIELFSETKRLEKVQLPNISITQPLKYSKKVSVYEYLNRYIELYSPKYKTIDRERTDSTKKCWKYIRKYTIDTQLESVFGSVYAPDFTLSNPTLRDVLSQLMIVADMIPYVKDDIIYAKDISKRNDYFDLQDLKNRNIIGGISATMSSDDYCDGVRRQYSNALSSEGICNYVDYLGFRNNTTALMSLENMELETTYPIYKIDKMYMCYYKYIELEKTSNGTTTTTPYYVLCKQDISKLMKLDTEYRLLKQDWRKTGNVFNIDECSQYQLFTIPYSQGSNKISGWGRKYETYQNTLLNTYSIQHTYIENLFRFMEHYYPYGIDTKTSLICKIEGLSPEEVVAGDYTVSAFPAGDLDDDNSFDTKYIFVPQSFGDYWKLGDSRQTITFNNQSDPLTLKCLFFQIEYKGFYNGALVHSRDEGNDNIISNDNSSSSLALLEKDGLNQKEKLNRFANKTYMMNARYTDDDAIKHLIKLGDVTAVDDEDDDVIIYKREYSIYNNMITVSYAGINDYVLKNYFTSVYSKYRTYQLMSYGESVLRAENRKELFVLSKNKKYADESIFLNLDKNLLFSAFKESPHYIDYIQSQNKQNINSGYFSIATSKYIERAGDYGDFATNKFAKDENSATSGNSLLFNIAMNDNISGGNYIEGWVANYGLLAAHPSDQENYVVGSAQNWYDMSDDKETGAIKHMGFYVAHKEITAPDFVLLTNEQSTQIKQSTNLFSHNKVVTLEDLYTNHLQYLPGMGSNSYYELTNSFGLEEDIYKDNKERIDMTFQLEPISVDKDVVISDWMSKLSDMSNAYNKCDEQYIFERNKSATINHEITINADDIQEQTTSNHVLLFTMPNFTNIFNNYVTNEIRAASGVIYIESLFKIRYFKFVVSGIKKSVDPTTNKDRIILYGFGGLYNQSTDVTIWTIDSMYFDKDTSTDEGKFAKYITISGFSESSSTVTIFEESAPGINTEIKINKNMFIKVSDSYIDKTIVNKLIAEKESDSEFEQNIKVNDVFNIVTNKFIAEINKSIFKNKVGTNYGVYSFIKSNLYQWNMSYDGQILFNINLEEYGISINGLSVIGDSFDINYYISDNTDTFDISYQFIKYENIPINSEDSYWIKVDSYKFGLGVSAEAGTYDFEYINSNKWLLSNKNAEIFNEYYNGVLFDLYTGHPNIDFDTFKEKDGRDGVYTFINIGDNKWDLEDVEYSTTHTIVDDISKYGIEIPNTKYFSKDDIIEVTYFRNGSQKALGFHKVPYTIDIENYGFTIQEDNDLLRGDIIQVRYWMNGIGSAILKRNGDYNLILPSFIDVDLSYFVNMSPRPKSIQYWYLDDKNGYKHTEESNIDKWEYEFSPNTYSYHFVFGLNLTDKDWEDYENGKPLRIYISETSNRDVRVFNSLGIQIGEIKNCIVDDEFEFPIHGQEYIDTIEDYNAKHITATINNPEYGFVNGAGEYYYGETAKLEAIPNNDCEFIKWNDDDINSIKSFIVKNNVEFSAIFYKWFTIINQDNSIPHTVNQYNPSAIIKTDNYSSKIKVSGTITSTSIPRSFSGVIDVEKNNSYENAKTLYDNIPTINDIKVKAYAEKNENDEVTLYLYGWESHAGGRVDDLDVTISNLKYLSEYESAEILIPHWQTVWEMDVDYNYPYLRATQAFTIIINDKQKFLNKVGHGSGVHKFTYRAGTGSEGYWELESGGEITSPINLTEYGLKYATYTSSTGASLTLGNVVVDDIFTIYVGANDTTNIIYDFANEVINFTDTYNKLDLSNMEDNKRTRLIIYMHIDTQPKFVLNEFSSAEFNYGTLTRKGNGTIFAGEITWNKENNILTLPVRLSQDTDISYWYGGIISGRWVRSDNETVGLIKIEQII